MDTDADGYGTVTESRLYQLIRQQGAVHDRTFRIEFQTPGVASLRIHLRIRRVSESGLFVENGFLSQKVDCLLKMDFTCRKPAP